MHGWITLMVCLLFVATECARIQNCPTGSLKVVADTADFSLTCVEYTATAAWSFQQPGDSSDPIGTCNSTCNAPSGFLDFFTLTPLSATSSRLNLTNRATSISNPQLIYTCETASCTVNIVVHAELSTPTITVTTPATGSGWTVRGSVDITRIFSTAGNYLCDWTVQHPNGSYTSIVNKTATIDTPDNGNSVKTGRCDLPDTPLYSAPGTYTYSVTVSPGHTTKAGNSVVVETPVTPGISCPTSQVLEDEEVSCTCRGDVGQPGGQLRMFLKNNNNVITALNDGRYGNDTLQMTFTVNRTHGELRCYTEWIKNSNQSEFIFDVAYGPDSAGIPENRSFYTDSTGSRDLNLTCKPGDVRPISGLTYSWTGRCAHSTTATCSFRPRPPGGASTSDVNATINCDVTNPNASKVARATYNLQLKYAPRDAPRISGYSNIDVLYQGDQLALTCDVRGGDPMVTSVTLNLTGHGQNETHGQSSRLSVTSLRASDHRAQAVCSGQWTKQSYYTLTDTRTLEVYYPPSDPKIRRVDGDTRPYLEKDNATLTCNLTSVGHPEASFHWSDHPHAEITNTGMTSSIMKIVSVDRGYNQIDITCRVTNDFTQHKQRDLKDVFTLEVYYISPNVTALSSNKCWMTSADTCVVKEGQKVHLNCSADSNPSLATAAWQQGSAYSLDFIANRSTSLKHVCHVTTTKVGSDERLPLRINITLIVLTTYAAQVSGFTSNNSNNLTVSEGDSPTLTCKAVGRPTPEMSIGKDDVSLNSRQKGQVTAEQQANLTLFLHEVTCDATGQYNCEVNNGEGQANTTHLMVFVKCSPRQQKGTPPIPSYLNYKGGSVSTVFSLTVYPAIRTWSLKYLSPNSSRPARPALYRVHCTVTQSSRPHLTTCNLTITGATQHDKGSYDLTLDNGVGQPFTFRLKLDVNGTDSEAFPIAAAVGGVLAAGAAVTVAAAGIFFFRRKQRGKKKEHYERAKNERRRDTEEPEMITNELYGTAGPQGDDDGEDETMIVNTMYETSEAVGAHVAARRQENASAYEDVAHDGIRPMVTPGPPPAAASAAMETGLYAIVDKGRQRQPTASTSAAASDDTNVYAAVDKSKKKSAPPQTAAKPEVKPKPGKKPKDKKKNKNSTKPDARQPLEETEDTANLYGNIGTTSRTTPPGEDGTVYENHAFTGDEGAVGGSQVEATTADGGNNERSRTVNADGLVYTTVAFSESQRQKENDPFPGREKTEYAKIGFPVKDLADQE